MRTLTIILLFSLTANSQSTTIGHTNGLSVWSYNRSGGIVGTIALDSTKNTLKQTGNQLRVIKDLATYVKTLRDRLQLAENVLQYIEKDGTIRYPIEFKTAWDLWIKENQ